MDERSRARLLAAHMNGLLSMGFSQEQAIQVNAKPLHVSLTRKLTLQIILNYSPPAISSIPNQYAVASEWRGKWWF